MSTFLVVVGITLGCFVAIFGMLLMASYGNDPLYHAIKAAAISLVVAIVLLVGAYVVDAPPGDPAPCYPGFGC